MVVKLRQFKHNSRICRRTEIFFLCQGKQCDRAEVHGPPPQHNCTRASDWINLATGTNYKLDKISKIEISLRKQKNLSGDCWYFCEGEWKTDNRAIARLISWKTIFRNSFEHPGILFIQVRVIIKGWINNYSNN